MDLTWLEDYLALADTLNFSRAAAGRHVTQPAFSRRIRALEAWVGTPLFLRTTHSVSLTPAGERFYDQAAALVRAVATARQDALDAAGRADGQITIAATHALSFTFFPAWVRRHERLMALGNLNLVSDSMDACEQMLVRGEAQFLLCHSHPGAASSLSALRFDSRIVGNDTLVPVSAAAPSGAPLWSLDAAQPARHLAYSDQSGLGRIVAARWPAIGRPWGLETVFRSHLAATLLSMARAGDGIAWLPLTLAADDLASGRLVQLGDGQFNIPIAIRLFRPKARLGRIAEEVWAATAASEGQAAETERTMVGPEGLEPPTKRL